MLHLVELHLPYILTAMGIKFTQYYELIIKYHNVKFILKFFQERP